HLQRALRAYVAAGENHVERGLEADAPRQSLRAAHPWNDAELHFRQRQRRSWMVGRDAVAAGQRQLEAGAQAGSMDRGDDGRAQLFHSLQQILPEPAHALGVRGRFEFLELLDVGARDERIGLAGDQYYSFNERILIDAQDDAFELADEGGAERVHGLAGFVDGDDEDVVFELGVERWAGLVMRAPPPSSAPFHPRRTPS